MLRLTHHALVLVLALLLSLSIVASADITVTYQGETPLGSGDGNEGIDGLATGDDSLWDYVYDLGGFPGFPNDPGLFAIRVSAPSEWIYNISSPTGWTGFYDDNIQAGDHHTTGADWSSLVGYSAVVWERNDPLQYGTTGFSFQSRLKPYRVIWETADGESTAVHGSGVEYSAAPEPCTMVLTSLGLLGLGAWRRRRTSV